MRSCRKPRFAVGTKYRQTTLILINELSHYDALHLDNQDEER
jgi:hypothetical protein